MHEWPARTSTQKREPRRTETRCVSTCTTLVHFSSPQILRIWMLSVTSCLCRSRRILIKVYKCHWMFNLTIWTWRKTFIFERNNKIFIQVYTWKVRTSKSLFYFFTQLFLTLATLYCWPLWKIWKGQMISSLSTLMGSVTVISNICQYISHVCLVWCPNFCPYAYFNNYLLLTSREHTSLEMLV
jgi:hypothetical protein